MDSMGRIRVWDISVGNDPKGHFYEVSHGVLDGQLQTNRVYVASGKNIGRSNETTVVGQCKAEALSEWTQQRDRKGYSETVPKTQPLKPMLAKVFKNEESKVKYPCVIQPKLDGSRCLAKVYDNKVELISRSMKLYEGLDHIEKELLNLHKKHGDLILDGELFSPDIKFEEIMSLVRKTKNHTTASTKIKFWVYDMISEELFHQRFIDWSNIITGLRNVVPTPTFIVKTREEIDSKHIKFVTEGYEGSMVRNLDSPYKINARSSDLLKLKNFDDSEFEIIGFKSGKGKYEDVPTFELKTEEGHVFEAVPKGNEEQRSEYLKNADGYIGKFATVRYFGLTNTDKPVPRFPVITILDRNAADPI